MAIYLRRSTDDEHQPFSLDAQEAALRSYVASQPDWSLVATFRDDASGATIDRPGLRAALDAAHAAEFDVLLVYRVDRFSRRLSDLLGLLAELEQAEVAFCSATEPFDTATSIGRMLAQLLGVFAEFERETIVDRVISGMRTKASKGKWCGGTRPYGYHVDARTHRLIIAPNEAPTVRDIFRLYTENRLGTRAIARDLNSRGLRNRVGRVWSGLTIARILANPAYRGDIAYRDVYVRAAHEPLIDPVIFQRARDIADARAVAPAGSTASGRATDSNYLLTGLITCPECGHKYVGCSATGRTRRYRYYTCFSRSRYGRHGCAAPRISADHLDIAVLRALHDFYVRAPRLLSSAISLAANRYAAEPVARRAEHAAASVRIRAHKATIERYYTAFETGAMSAELAGERLGDLGVELEQLIAHRDALGASDDDANFALAPVLAADELGDRFDEVIANGTSAEHRTLISALVAEVQITSTGVVPLFRTPPA